MRASSRAVTHTQRAPSGASARPRAESREQQHARLCAALLQVPGEVPAVLQRYLAKFSARAPDVAGLLGAGWTGTKLCDAYRETVKDASFELRPEDVMVLGGSDPKDTSVTVLAVARPRWGGEVPLGYVLFSFFPSEKGLTSELLYLMKNMDRPETKSLGAELYAGLEQVERQVGVQHKTLMADWVGRGYWPRQGFDCTPEDLRTLKDRFRTFLREFGINPGDLYFDRGGERRPFSFEGLQHSWDFLDVRSDRGGVEVPLFLGDGNLVDKKLPIGGAFMRGPHEDYHPDCNFFSHKWYGHKPGDDWQE